MSPSSVDYSLEIFPLERRPGEATTVANWIMSEWGRLPIHEYLEAITKGESWPQTLPRTLVASSEGKIVGTSSILLSDLETRREIDPWLGCLYVDPKCRRRGVGTRLLLAAEKLAANQLGITRIYLFTENQSALYARHGWQVVESDSYHGKPITIMTKVLAPQKIGSTSRKKI